MSEIIGRELGWEDTIENEGPDFEVLPEGDYIFTVKKFERGRHKGSEKIPPCNKAVLTLEISSGKNTTEITHNLFLHQNVEGLLCAFFTAIGQRQKGEKLQMNWSEVIGSKGKAKVFIDKWTYNGQEYSANKIKRFYEPTETPPVQQSQQNWQSGKF